MIEYACLVELTVKQAKIETDRSIVEDRQDGRGERGVTREDAQFKLKGFKVVFDSEGEVQKFVDEVIQRKFQICLVGPKFLKVRK